MLRDACRQHSGAQSSLGQAAFLVLVQVGFGSGYVPFCGEHDTGLHSVGCCVPSANSPGRFLVPAVLVDEFLGSCSPRLALSHRLVW